MPDYGPFINIGTSFLASRIRARGRDVKIERDVEIELDKDRPALREAEELVAKSTRPDEDVELEIETPFIPPADLFAGIYDREAAKQLLTQALRSPRPVHVLLKGDAGTGKSALLSRIAQLPRSRYAVGGATTSAGLIGYLVETPNTRNLVIDELDKADPADLYSLYSLMESGILTRLQHANRDETIRRVWVFAGCNSTAKIPPALLSRFVELELPAYSGEQVREIGRLALEAEGLPPARARAIAAAVSKRSHDPRDIVQAGRLAGGTVDVDVVVDQVRPARK